MLGAYMQRIGDGGVVATGLDMLAISVKQMGNFDDTLLNPYWSASARSISGLSKCHRNPEITPPLNEFCKSLVYGYKNLFNCKLVVIHVS